MNYQGDIRLGDTIDVKFCTVNTSGVPTQLAGSPVISAYPGNSTTQITSGITLTVDFDAVTGLNNVRVVASSGNGYATATNYQLVITTGTVSGSSVVGYVVGSFSIENRSALMPTTAARTLDVSSGGEAGLDWANIGSPTTTVSLSGTSTKSLQPTVAGRTLDVSAGGEAGVDWANVGSPTTSVNLSGTTISTSQAVASVSGAVGSVTGNVGGNVTGSVGSVTTGGITRASFAADTGLQSIRSNTAQAGAAGTITLDASASATNDFYLNTLVLLTGGTGAGQVRRISDYVGSTKVASVVPNWTTTPDNTSTFAILPAGSVWDEVLADHLTSGSTGAALNAAGAAGDPWSTTLPGAYGAGTAGFIVGTNLDAAVTSRLAPTTAGRTLDVSAGGEAGIDWSNIGSPTTAQNLSGTNIDPDQVVASVTGAVGSVGTDGITSASLATSAITEIQTGLATAADLASTEATLAADIAGVQADTDNIQTRLPGALVGGRMDASVGAYQSGLTPLQPTVAGRTLDVTATGAAGVDWGNVENQATVVGLSGTTIKDATDIATDIAAVPAAVWTEQVDGTITAEESLRLANAANGGKLSGAATTSVAIRNPADTKNRVAATVDADGNRTAVTLDLT